MEELLFEYHDKDQRHLASITSSEEEADNIERDRLQSNLDWAEQEELKERKAEEEKIRKKKEQQEADEKWMQEQLIKEGKEKFGEDFGGDIEENFES